LARKKNSHPLANEKPTKLVGEKTLIKPTVTFSQKKIKPKKKQPTESLRRQLRESPTSLSKKLPVNGGLKCIKNGNFLN